MFDKIFVEERVLSNRYAQNILRQLGNDKEAIPIERITDVFERVRKPYLHKRTHLNVFIGKKEGLLVKEAAFNYGFGNFKHYYFIHSYNCIYECQYCYLQGYFHSPDLVFFVNHDEILVEIERIVRENDGREVWFHGGEFSDNLCLSHYSLEWEDYFELFRLHPQAKLELRTKSANVRVIENLHPIPNAYISFSLSPRLAIERFDLKTPSLDGRLKAMKRLAEKKFSLGVHFDPIIDAPNLLEQYQSLIGRLFEEISMDSIHYVSLGIVRFSKDSYRHMSRNYPESLILKERFLSGETGKTSYCEFKRNWILREIEALLIQFGYGKEKIYKCMEDAD